MRCFFRAIIGVKNFLFQATAQWLLCTGAAAELLDGKTLATCGFSHPENVIDNPRAGRVVILYLFNNFVTALGFASFLLIFGGRS
jgi:hypothetical protein